MPTVDWIIVTGIAALLGLAVFGWIATGTLDHIPELLAPEISTPEPPDAKFIETE